MLTRYKPGDWNAVCYECGRKRKASELVKNWQGFFVCSEHNDPRQPQDFVRAVDEDPSAPWAQEEPAVKYDYTDTVLGYGDGVKTQFQLGSGLYPVAISIIKVDGQPATFTSNGIGLITLESPPGKFIMVSGNGVETVP